jgi:hypothetical protein
MMSATTLDDVEAFMFAYRELHLPGKVNANSAIFRLYKEMKHKDLWLETEDLKKNKDPILSALSMQVVSSTMMLIEDFVKMCYCMSQDILTIPSTMASYTELTDMLQYFENEMASKGDEAFLNILHYSDRKELDEQDFTFLTEDDKQLILRQHQQNAKAVKHTYSYAVRVYATFRRSYNKHKHGHPFLFSMGLQQPSAPAPFDKLAPAIPYFANEKNVAIAEPVFVGEVVLDKINGLIEGAGALRSLLYDLTMNVTIRCKCGARRIIATKGYGPPVMSEKEVVRYKQIVSEFEKRFIIDPSPKKLKMQINSNLRKTDWDYFTQDWMMK